MKNSDVCERYTKKCCWKKLVRQSIIFFYFNFSLDSCTSLRRILARTLSERASRSWLVSHRHPVWTYFRIHAYAIVLVDRWKCGSRWKRFLDMSTEALNATRARGWKKGLTFLFFERVAYTRSTYRAFQKTRSLRVDWGSGDWILIRL